MQNKNGRVLMRRSRYTDIITSHITGHIPLSDNELVHHSIIETYKEHNIIDLMVGEKCFFKGGYACFDITMVIETNTKHINKEKLLHGFSLLDVDDHLSIDLVCHDQYIDSCYIMWYR